MSTPNDDNANDSGPSRSRRERSTRYPGVPLAESIELTRFVESKGLDGLSAGDIATALGYKNIKTNTFSARLSAARQFGLLELKDEGYWVTPLARSILHPMDPAELPKLYRKALLVPPLYSDLAERLGGKRVPDAPILGNILYHHHAIIANAKQAAAEYFIESAKFAGALGEDLIFRPEGLGGPDESPAPAPTASKPTPAETPVAATPSSKPAATVPRVAAAPGTPRTRFDLLLWGPDQGKAVRVRAPESMTEESFERLVQALRLHIKIEQPNPSTQ